MPRPDPRATAGFEVALARRMLAREPGLNGLCSPFVVTQALTVLAAGARGDTAAEFDAVLGCSGRRAVDEHHLGQDWIEAISNESSGGWGDQPERRERLDLVHTAAGIWSRVAIEAELRRTFPEIGLGRLGIDDPDAWVAEQTRGRISSLAVPIDEDTLAVLVAVLDLTAAWSRPFEAHATATADFTRSDGVVVTVPTMARTLSLATSLASGVRRVDLPLRSSWQGPPVLVRLAIGQEHAADQVVAGLFAEEEAGDPHRPIDLAVPRFSIDRRGTGLDLVEPLRALGLRLVFTDDAELDGISADPLRIQGAVQQAWFEIDEDGARGTATAEFAAMAGRAAGEPEAPLVVRFDRPFAFGVLVAGGPVLFCGWVGDPSAE